MNKTVFSLVLLFAAVILMVQSAPQKQGTGPKNSHEKVSKPSRTHQQGSSRTSGQKNS